MKKLMIVAALAAMTTGAFADATVYEYKLTLNTTTCKSGKAAKNTYLTSALGGYEAGEEVVYRTPAKLTIYGVAWGCECDTALAGTWSEREVVINRKGDTTNVWDGLTFWNKKTDGFLGGVYNGVEIENDFFNRIGKKGDQVEMSFTIQNSDAATSGDFELKCAGFGTIQNGYKKDDDGVVESDCYSYIKSAKGSVAGFLFPEDDAFVCTFCGTEETYCDVWEFCECGEFADADKTVAYGTWTMKYVKAASKALQTKLYITKSYSGFTKNVKAELVDAGE